MFKRLLLTGAAGKLGSFLRPHLKTLCHTLVLSDIVAPAQAAADNEEFSLCDLSNQASVLALLAGCDGVVHFGGISHERPLDSLAPANLLGIGYLYDAAVTHGVSRIVQASSNHVSGFYPSGAQLAYDAPFRPDSLYGVSKAYGEVLARFYFDRFGIESACLRIGSCNVAPKSLRCLSYWLSPRDFCHLVERALCCEQLGFATLWGISANQQNNWGLDDAQRIGYHPQDSAEPWRAEIVLQRAADLHDPRQRLQGGSMTSRNYRERDTLYPAPPPKYDAKA